LISYYFFIESSAGRESQLSSPALRKVFNMNLGTCDNCGKMMTIADCIQEENGNIFCGKDCKEKYAGRDLISGNPTPPTTDVFYDY